MLNNYWIFLAICGGVFLIIVESAFIATSPTTTNTSKHERISKHSLLLARKRAKEMANLRFKENFLKETKPRSLYEKVKVRKNIESPVAATASSSAYVPRNFFASPDLLNSNNGSLDDDYKCDFSNRTLAQMVRFVRSPHNCRVFHVCAYWKQFSLTCIDGLYFDENLNTCSYEYLVDCPIDNKLIGTDKDTAINKMNVKQQTDPIQSTTTKQEWQTMPLKSSIPVLPETSSKPTEASTTSTTTTTTITSTTTTTASTTTTLPTTTTTSTQPTTTTTTSTTSTSTSTTKLAPATLTPNAANELITSDDKKPLIYTPQYSPITYLLFTYNSDKSSLLPESKSSYSSQPLVDSTISDQSSSKSTFEPSSYYPSTLSEENASRTNKIASNTLPFSSLSLLNNYQQTSKIASSGESISNSNTTSDIKPSSTSSSFYDRFFETTSFPKVQLNTDKLEQYSNGTRPWWLSPTECVPGFEHRIAHRENCGKYYECQLNGEKIERACPYPQQYDELYSECRPYNLVDCAKRAHAKDLCDYKLSNTLFQTIPCSLYPSCKNLSDGLYPDELRDCRHYFQCKDQRTLRTFSCPTNTTYGVNLKFNFMTRRCDLVEYVSFNCGGYTIPVDIYTNEMKCPSHNNQIQSGEQTLAFDMKEIYFSHPKDCGVYLKCDRNANMTRLDCPPGTHFSPYYQSCVHPSIANCKKYLLMDDSPIIPSRFQHRDDDDNNNSGNFKSPNNHNNKYNYNEIFMDYYSSPVLSADESFERSTY